MIDQLQQEDIHIFFAFKQQILTKKSINDIENEMNQRLSEDSLDLKALTILEQISYQYNCDYKKALKLIKQGLQSDQNNVDLLLDLAEILIDYELKDQDDCQNILNICFKLDSQYWRCYYVQALLQTEFNQDHLQRKTLLEGLELNPKNPWLSTFLSQTYSDYQIMSQKAQDLVKDIDIAQCNYELIRRLGYTLYFLKQKGADKYFQRAHLLNPKNIKVTCNLATHERLDRKNFQNSLNLCLNIYKIHETNQLLFNIARSYQFLKDKEQLVPFYKKCCYSKKFLSAYENLGIFYLEQQDWYQGLYNIKKALKYDEKSDYLYYKYLSIELAQENDYEEYEDMLNMFYNISKMNSEDYLIDIIYLNEYKIKIYQKQN